MVFYRTYRPQTLETLDNPQVRTLLGRFLSQKDIPHAFLFTGPKGTGKTSAARIVAKSLNCEKEKIGGCGKCDSCISIGEGTTIDVLELDAASNRGIDEIRSLKEGIKLSPLSLKYKVYIIDEVHMLTTEAFNALLKTLEEPPRHAVFILATTESGKVPDTIISRCIMIPFTTGGRESIVASLTRIVIGEKLDVEEGVLEELAQLAEGSFRDAAKLLEQIAMGEKKVTRDVLKKSLGTSQENTQKEFVALLKHKKMPELLKLIQTLQKQEINIRLFLKDVLTELEELLLKSVAEKSEWTTHELIRALNIFSSTWANFKSALIPALPLELAIVEYCTSDEKPVLDKSPVVKSSVSVFNPSVSSIDRSGTVLNEKWDMILEALKSYNHSLVGVLRSCRPISFKDGVVMIESPYKFHAERISEPKTRDLIAQVIGGVLGSVVRIETILKPA